MSQTPSFPLQVFYDGSCSVCAGEIDVYRRQEHGGRLVFSDISAPEFRPELYGIPLEAFMHEMHAIDRENRVYRGIDAFNAIWQALPAGSIYRILGTVLTLPVVHTAARAGYWCFARIRRFLPKTGSGCHDGSCKVGRKAP